MGSSPGPHHGITITLFHLVLILLNYAHIDEFLVNIDIFCGLICFLKSDDERL